MTDPNFERETKHALYARVMGRLIHAHRTWRSISQDQLRILVGCSQPMISRIECGDHTPNFCMLMEFERAFDLCEGDLLTHLRVALAKMRGVMDPTGALTLVRWREQAMDNRGINGLIDFVIEASRDQIGPR